MSEKTQRDLWLEVCRSLSKMFNTTVQFHIDTEREIVHLKVDKIDYNITDNINMYRCSETEFNEMVATLVANYGSVLVTEFHKKHL